MKKVFFLGILVLSATFLSGCTLQREDSEIVVQKKEQKAEVLYSIEAARATGNKMVCIRYPDSSKNQINSTLYVEGDKYINESGNNQNVVLTHLFDGSVQYAWQSSSKAGKKISISCMNNLLESYPESKVEQEKAWNYPVSQQATYTMKGSKLEPYIECSSVDTIDFSVPTDIVFSDYCSTLEDTLMKQRVSN